MRNTSALRVALATSALALITSTASAQANAEALANAVRFGKPAVVRSLLDGGADPNARIDEGGGGNAVNIAFTALNGMALLNRLDEPDPAKHADALEVLRLLVARKPNLDIPVRIAQRDVTPLMIAAEAGALDVVRVLLDGGADPNAKNSGRYTALDMASDRPPFWSTFPKTDRAEIVRLLLAKGARADRAGADGVRPAARAKRAGLTDVAALLESHAP